MRMSKTALRAKLFVKITDGVAEKMGCGLFVLCQDEDGGSHRVVLTESDIAAMANDSGPSLALKDGTAEYIGDGRWIVQQVDELEPLPQIVVVNRGDVQAILAAA